jgi:glucosamine 6-phosphate synthetase-like amidotransferase/phosphosugar isomerase protein
MCGIAGFNLTERSAVSRTAAARVLLAGIAERGADAAGYAYRHDGPTARIHKQRSGASALLGEVVLPETTRHLLLHVRDYTKGHPKIEANNHPIRHGAVVGIHNGLIVNDDEIFDSRGWDRAHPEMTVDSEAIFALLNDTPGPETLEELYGAMATAWIDERRPDQLFLARGVGRPLWLGQGRHETFFASTRHTLELVERFLDLRLSKREVPEGSYVTLRADGDVEWASFKPEHYVEERPLPAVRAPQERDSCLRLLPAAVAAFL